MAAFIWAKQNGDWIPVIADASGHLQIDILSSALPTGAATSAKQDTMITALQLIDDLRNALGSVDTDDLQVDVKTCANPSNLDVALSTRALESGGNLASILAKLDITTSALRDAIRGASTKDFTTLEADIEAIKANQAIQLSRDQSWISASDTSTTGTTTLHTVTAGKVFYLVFASIYVYAVTAADKGGSVQWYNEIGGFQGILCGQHMITAAGGAGFALAFPIPLPFAAGFTLRVYSDGNLTARGTIYGWEE